MYFIGLRRDLLKQCRVVLLQVRTLLLQFDVLLLKRGVMLHQPRENDVLFIHPPFYNSFSRRAQSYYSEFGKKICEWLERQASWQGVTNERVVQRKDQPSALASSHASAAVRL
jgi:hypothetical protein